METVQEYPDRNFFKSSLILTFLHPKYYSIYRHLANTDILAHMCTHSTHILISYIYQAHPHTKYMHTSHTYSIYRTIHACHTQHTY